ncbi:hypothetical protein Tco_1208317, partial [Tanacetum coccineum]
WVVPKIGSIAVKTISCGVLALPKACLEICLEAWSLCFFACEVRWVGFPCFVILGFGSVLSVWSHGWRQSVDTKVGRSLIRSELGVILESIYWKIYSPIDALKNNMQAKVLPEKMLSELGMKQLCKILYQDTNHKCEFCGKEEVNNYVPAVILEELFEDKSESVMHDEYE